jgi:hypothetical protein
MKRTIFSIHPMIRNTLLIIPLLLVITVYFLRHGVTVDSLNIGQFKVQGLYLKLDKKLVAKIDYLALPKKKKKADFSQLEAVMDRIKWLPKYFLSVSLDEVDVGGDHYRIIYKDNAIYLSSNEYEIAGMLERKGDVIEGKFPLLLVKKYNLRMKGKFQYEYQKDILAIDANYTIVGVRGRLLAKNSGEKTSFRVDTATFADMKPILKLFEADKTTQEWLIDRIHAKKYQLKSLEGLVVQTSNGYDLNPMSVTAKVHVIGATVRFNNKLEKIHVNSADVTLKKNILYVVAHNPTYAKKSLEGTTFHLTNILGPNPSKIHLVVKSNTRYDKALEKVLKNYNVSLPLIQRKGVVKAIVNLDIVARSGDTTIKGSAKLGKGSIDLYGVPIKVYAGKVDFDDHHVVLHDVDADTGWLKAVVNGTLNLDKKRALLSTNVKRLTFGDKASPFISMKNKRKIPIKFYWKTRSKVDIPLYKTSIVFNTKNGFTVSCSDIKPILPYIKGIPIAIKSGSIQIKTKDSKRYSFTGKTTWPSSYLYDKNGPIVTFPISGTFSKSSTSLSALKGRVKYSSAKSLVQLSNLYIDGKKVLDSNKKSSNKSIKIHVKGSNSLIRYEKYVLLSDRFDLRVNGKHTRFSATKDGDTVRIELNGDAIVIKADQIKASMLRALVHFGGLSGGRYSLNLHGRMNGTMKGVITVKGGVAKSFKTYNNMIALFNAVPALSTLSDPGFSEKGFEIRTGRIEFRIVKNRVFFDMIYIDGKSAAISGKGTVSTVNGAINMDLAVRTARDIGKIIGSIPIVGYILMGKDKSITTGVKVTGTLDNPKVNTHVVMETLLAPFEMFVRTIKSPAHIINN